MSEKKKPGYAYHLFAGEAYYPVGDRFHLNDVLADYIGSFATLEGARFNIDPEKHDWWQIVRSQDGSLALVSVASSDDEGAK